MVSVILKSGQRIFVIIEIMFVEFSGNQIIKKKSEIIKIHMKCNLLEGEVYLEHPLR